MQERWSRTKKKRSFNWVWVWVSDVKVSNQNSKLKLDETFALQSSLFLEDLLRMYQRFAHERGWCADLVEASEASAGLKNAILEVTGEGTFDVLQFESGVHRVQRVPVTETGGRVHTSTVTVMVNFYLSSSCRIWPPSQALPHDPNVGSSTSDELYDPKDIKVEVMRSRGAGGQVCLIHLCSTPSLTSTSYIARKQNRISRPPDSHPNRNHRVDARWAKSAYGTYFTTQAFKNDFIEFHIILEQSKSISSPSG